MLEWWGLLQPSDQGDGLAQAEKRPQAPAERWPNTEADRCGTKIRVLILDLSRRPTWSIFKRNTGLSPQALVETAAALASGPAFSLPSVARPLVGMQASQQHHEVKSVLGGVKPVVAPTGRFIQLGLAVTDIEKRCGTMGQTARIPHCD
jgi:hypothetical protein